MTGDVVVNDCSFASNTGDEGGAIYGLNWTGVATGCTFTGNSSTYGGAVNLTGCDASFSTCTFSGNAETIGPTDGDNPGNGGAIFSDGGSVDLINDVISNNSAVNGGAVYISNAPSATLTACVFTSNSAPSGEGGAIYGYNSSSTLNACVFKLNSSAVGGGLYDITGTLTIANSVFVDNAALYVFSQNNLESGRGGGIAAIDSNVSIVDTTIAFDHSNPPSAAGITHVVDPTGGGIYISSEGSYAINGIDFSLRNSIIWGNTASRDPGIDALSISPSFSNNDISGGTGGPPAANFNPWFVRNPSPGPDGKWGTADDDLGDLHLQYNSPALGKGNPALLPASDTTDASGNPRLRSGQLDLGAYETGPADFAVSTLSLKPLRSPATPTNLSLSGTLSVLNDGSSVPSGKLTVELFLSSTTNVPTGTPAASPIATLLVSTAHLTPGTPFRLPFSLRLKGKTAAGTYYVVAEANPNNALPEATETNNTTASPALTL
jgi:predicted outer membrane repeat protein